MKMKSLLALTALSVAGAAVAVEATSDNTLCRIEVASTLTNTVVSVPLKTVGGAKEAIKLTDLVLTDNLTDGDHLLHKNGADWEAWVLAGGKWNAANVSDASVTTIAGSDAELPTGDAFWLVRQNPSKSFYLYGEVAGDKKLTISRGAAANYILMGNPKLADVAIDELPFAGTPVAGDKIVIPTPGVVMGIKEYVYTTIDGTDCWGESTVEIVTRNNGLKMAKLKVVKADVTIPAGQGFWYVAKPSAN